MAKLEQKPELRPVSARQLVENTILECRVAGQEQLVVDRLRVHAAPEIVEAGKGGARAAAGAAPLPWRAHLLVHAKAGIVTASWRLTFFAIKQLPLSIAAPVRATAPLFVLLGAVLLFGERPTALQWVGIGAIVASYFAFSVLGKAEGIHFGRDRWVWMLFAGMLVGACSGLYDKHLLQGAALPPMTLQLWFTLYNAALQGLLVAALWWPRRAHGSRFRPTLTRLGMRESEISP